ncbi:MAG: hypothetical protein ABSA97_15285, partial [Verrucomicrobiia bacterium]
KITVDVPHGLATGKKVYIEGVQGNTAANGYHAITVTDVDSTGLSTKFTLDSVAGNGAWTGGGEVYFLANDVDTVLFSGSDQDTRTGNVVNGRERVFVVGQRVATAVAATYYSRALQAYTDHRYRITCGADTAEGPFRTSNIPVGATYGDPFPTDPASPGTAAWPTLAGNSRMEWVIDPQTGVKLQPVTRTAEFVGGGVNSYAGLSCTDVLVTTSDGKQGWHCKAGATDLYHQNSLYWVEQGGRSARYLGGLAFKSNAIQGVASNSAGNCLGGIDTSNPNIFYCLYTLGTAGQLWVVRGTYSGHSTGRDTDHHGRTAANDYLEDTVWTALNPATGLRALAEAWDTAYGTGQLVNFGGTQWKGEGIQDGKLFIVVDQNGTDSLAWYIVFDPAKVGTTPGCVGVGNPGCVIAVTSSYLGSALAPNRWAGDHGFNVIPWGLAGTGWLTMALNPQPGGGAGRGPYSSTITAVNGGAAQVDACPGGAGSCVTCPAQPVENPITNWPTGSTCTQVTVSSVTPTAPNSPTTLPLPWGNWLVGDYACWGFSGGRCATERVRVLTVDAGTGNIWLQRGFQNTAKEAHNPQTTLYAMDTAVDNDTTTALVWWNWESDPAGTAMLRSYNTRIGGHRDIGVVAGQSWMMGVGPDYGFGSNPTPLPGLLTTTGQRTNPIVWFPYFASTQLYRAGTNGLETHVAYRQSAASSAESAWASDLRPYLGDALTVTASCVYSVTGDLWLLSCTNVTALANAYKKVPLVGHSNGRALLEVTGPSSSITGDSGDNYKFCVALRDSECYAGSTAGQVYMNAPGVTNYAYCKSIRGGTPSPDLCLTQQLPTMTAAVQVDITRADSTGSSIRLVSHGTWPTERPGPTDFDTAARAMGLPDGTAVAFDGYVNGNATDQVMVAHTPPWPVLDSINRTTFLPLPKQLDSPPGGTDNAVIEFGYNANFYCTQRAEACVANSATISESSPFQWAGDTFAGLPCGSGCSIVIPAIAQRVVYYRFKYRRGSAVIATSDTEVAVVP